MGRGAGAAHHVPMDETLPPLIQALLEPWRYAHAVHQVELVQTHISWVLLAGEFAYKIKKPLKLPFLDFSTLALRRACCEDELRLNRRFAPDIYLAVVGIFQTPKGPQWSGEGRVIGEGEPIEYAVRMRRFDEAMRLDRVCDRGALRPQHLSGLADTLVAFHAATAVAPQASRFGAASDIITPARDNFTELHQLLPQGAVHTRLTALQAWTEKQFQQLAPLMEARKQAGWVRECHGDLHLANLVLVGERVRMFDCIEFNEDLRWIDVANELAFPYEDLLAHQQPGLATWFVNEVLSRNGDYESAQVLRFYAVYRALVRAKVAALRTAPTHADKGGSQAMAHIALAERLVAPPAAQLVITHGLSGCGKTVASSALLQNDAEASTLRLRSDVERKRLYGLALSQPSDCATGAGIYTEEAHARTYGRLRGVAATLLRAGWSVVVDAAFLRRSERDAFRLLAQELGVAFAILAPQATPAQLRARIQARSAEGGEGGDGGDVSEATLDVLEQQMRVIEPLAPDEALA